MKHLLSKIKGFFASLARASKADDAQDSSVHPANFWPRGPKGQFLPRQSMYPPSFDDCD